MPILTDFVAALSITVWISVTGFMNSVLCGCNYVYTIVTIMHIEKHTVLCDGQTVEVEIM